MLTVAKTSPKDTKEYKNVVAMVIPAYNGQVEILPGHAEGFFLLKQGKVMIMDEGEKVNEVEVEEGGCYVKDDKVFLMIDSEDKEKIA